MEKPIVDIMSVTLQKIKEMVDANTVIGEMITTPDGTCIIPISKISLGFASGGSEFGGKKEESRQNFGGGGGAGMTVSPVAFIIVSEGKVRLLSIEAPPENSIERAVDMVPGVIDKIGEIIDKFKKDKEA